MGVKLPDDLEFVCKDFGHNPWNREGSEWKYSPSQRRYYRVYPPNQVKIIDAKYLPNPEMLLAKRIEVSTGQVNIDALKPSAAIYALWEHQKSLNKRFDVVS